MKNTRLTSILNSSLIACALTIGSLALTPFSSAQAPMAEVNIPFAFQTATRTLPAGIYLIHRQSAHVIRLEGPGFARGFEITHEIVKSHASNQVVIIFNRYGDKYFLRQIWTAGDNAGLECPKSRAENQEAKNKQSPGSTLLAFNSPSQTLNSK
jgi:hypothetical protein